MPKKVSQPQDKYVLRLPDGMRDRIKAQADRNGRSMNAEIVQALEMVFPAEPTIEEVLDRVHEVMERSERAYALPYRRSLIDALDQLSDRLSAGIEFDQFYSHTPPQTVVEMPDTAARLKRFHRAGRYGVETHDLERQLEAGLLRHFGREEIDRAHHDFRSGNPKGALRVLRLDVLKFRDEEAAFDAIRRNVDKRHAEMHGWQIPPGAVLEDE